MLPPHLPPHELPHILDIQQFTVRVTRQAKLAICSADGQLVRGAAFYDNEKEN